LTVFGPLFVLDPIQDGKMKNCIFVTPRDVIQGGHVNLMEIFLEIISRDLKPPQKHHDNG